MADTPNLFHLFMISKIPCKKRRRLRVIIPNAARVMRHVWQGDKGVIETPSRDKQDVQHRACHRVRDKSEMTHLKFFSLNLSITVSVLSSVKLL
jgi:hypothetical protein